MTGKLFVSSLVLLMSARLVYPLELPEERRLYIDAFDNSGPPRYDYLETVLRTALLQEASRLVFVTLSERERTLLAERIGRDAAGTGTEPDAEQDSGAQEGARPGTRPEEIPFRLKLSPTLEQPGGGSTPLVVQGWYLVQPGSGEAELFQADLSVFDTLTGESDARYSFSAPLSRFLDDPGSLVAPLFERFLPSRAVHLAVTAVPGDSFIYLNDEPVGVGTFTGLLPPGTYRLAVERQGYSTRTTLVRADRDRELYIALERSAAVREILIRSDVPGASVYLDNRLQGTVPLELPLPPSSVITVTGEGYRTEMIPAREIPEGSTAVTVNLRTPGAIAGLESEGIRHRKKASLYSYAALGLLFVSIVLVSQTQKYGQLSSLYAGTDPARAEDALDKKRVFGALTIASSLLTGGAATLSFYHTVTYFNLFERAGTARLEFNEEP